MSRLHVDVVTYLAVGSAAQLLVRERGLAIELFEDPPFGGARLDLGQRSRVVAGATEAACTTLAAALQRPA